MKHLTILIILSSLIACGSSASIDTTTVLPEFEDLIEVTTIVQQDISSDYNNDNVEELNLGDLEGNLFCLLIVLHCQLLRARVLLFTLSAVTRALLFIMSAVVNS
jgi:hypothetical protein